MKDIKVKLLLLIAFFFAASSIAKAQAKPIGPTPDALGYVADWWELEYFQCDPLACESNGGPFEVGSVSTTATGPCFNGLTLSVGATSFLNNCSAPYFLTSAAGSDTSTERVRVGAQYKNYVLDGLSAVSSILDDNGVLVTTYSELKWCNGIYFIGTPIVGPC